MPLESDKRTRVDKIRKTPLSLQAQRGFSYRFYFVPSCSAAAARRAKAPPHIQCGGAFV